MLYLTNAFSLNMLDIEDTTSIKIIPISTEDTKALLQADADILISAVGHEDTARILTNILGIEVKPNRINVKLSRYDYTIVAQYTGPRLPEGTTELPDGAIIKFYIISIN